MISEVLICSRTISLYSQCSQVVHPKKKHLKVPEFCRSDFGYFWLFFKSAGTSPVRYVLKIHFFIEFGLKMIQFKIQFKTKSKIFIQKNIHSKQNPKYSFKKIFIQ